MLVLCDRNLTTHTLTGRIAAADAHLLGRCKANRKLPLVGRLHDGSYLSVLGGSPSVSSTPRAPSPPAPAGPAAATGLPPP
jgi:hypothetical protein